MRPGDGRRLLSLPFDGGLVLVDEPHQRLHLLNPAAAAIWTVIEAGLSPSESAALLASHTGRDSAACADDILAMEEQWRTDGTFDAVPPAPERQAALTRNGDDAAAFYVVNGIRLELKSESAELAARVAATLGECLAPAGDTALQLSVRVDAEGRLVLLADGQPWLTADDPGEIVGGIFHLLLQSRWGKDGWLTMIHGAALKRDGAAILFPAPSGAGKTTLAAYLSRRGFALMADDLAAVRANGKVVPWPTQLSIKRGSWRVLAPVMPELEDLPEQELVTRRVKLAACGRDAWDQPQVTVGALVLPRWTPGEPASLARLSPFDALAALVADRVWVGWPMTEGRVQGLLDWLERVPAWQLRYPDLESAEAQVAQIYQAA